MLYPALVTVTVSVGKIQLWISHDAASHAQLAYRFVACEEGLFRAPAGPQTSGFLWDLHSQLARARAQGTTCSCQTGRPRRRLRGPPEGKTRDLSLRNIPSQQAGTRRTQRPHGVIAQSQTGFKSCAITSRMTRASYLTSLYLCFLICQMGEIAELIE